MKNKKTIFKYLSFSLLLLCILPLMLFSLVSCDDEEAPQPTTIYYTATFDFKNGDEPYVVRVEDGTLAVPPIPPERENYIFNGWKSKGYYWNFSQDHIYEDVNFVAQWIDASSIFTTEKNSDDSVTVTAYSGFLSEIRIPEVISGLKVTAIGDNVFNDYGNSNTTVIVLPETVSSVGASAFKDCDAIKVEIEGKLSHIGDEAFNGCLLLENITFADDLKTIPYKAFAGCTALKDIKIPKGVTTIAEDAFDGCAAFQTIIIASTDLTVENGAFANCDGLLTVFFEGSKEEWEAIVPKIDAGGGGNDDLLEAKVYFYSETEAEGDYWRYDNGEPRCW